jgi:hypothetical protein
MGRVSDSASRKNHGISHFCRSNPVGDLFLDPRREQWALRDWSRQVNVTEVVWHYSCSFLYVGEAPRAGRARLAMHAGHPDLNEQKTASALALLEDATEKPAGWN